MNTQLKKGALELCTLAQLASYDRYGYELTDAISQEMSIAAGTLYLVLKRLKEEAYVETYLVESAGGPARKYYHLTDTGRQYLQESLTEWQEYVEAVNRLITADGGKSDE